ncbi:protein of unknown function [Methylocaldum szegediense]|uniref:Uncharacterized protein n=1 Tax=Methylocaldum szegediense TaxID=73780 RepID=A0ABN8X6U1_9GAMM|nr:protein of unknown function [Methylocaldum szegediense]
MPLRYALAPVNPPHGLMDTVVPGKMKGQVNLAEACACLKALTTAPAATPLDQAILIEGHIPSPWSARAGQFNRSRSAPRLKLSDRA